VLVVKRLMPSLLSALDDLSQHVMGQVISVCGGAVLTQN
jgi:hypothetical protein